MLLSVPESLVLFALHDERGTIRSSAYISLDPALRGAILGELLLRGHVRVHRDGRVRWTLSPPSDIGSPLLASAVDALRIVDDEAPVEAWMAALESGLPDLRDQVIAKLRARGAVAEAVIDREGLRDTTTWPTGEAAWERNMASAVRQAIATGPQISRRMGTLVALLHVCDLWSAFGDPGLTAQGRGVGEWVIGRDALCSAVRIAVHKAEGTYEG